MRADRELSYEVKGDSTAVVKHKKSSLSLIFMSLLPLFSVFSIILSGVINRANSIDIIRIGMIAFLLTTAMVFFIRFQEHIIKVPFAAGILYISYLTSIFLIMLIKSPEVYSFWMIGSLIIAMLVDNRLGLLVYFNMTLVVSVAYSLKHEVIIHLMIMGVLFILLSGYLRKKATVVYAAIILLSSNITLAFIMNNFIFETNTNVNYLASFFSIFAVLAAAFLLSLLYDRLLERRKRNERAIIASDRTAAGSEPVSDTGVSQSREDEASGNGISSSDNIQGTSYEALLSEDNELLIRIKEHSESLYNHCKWIGDLSGKAAAVIGANEALARAGGYYHEAGKIIGNNYIEEGLKLADQYGFPQELRDILKQHNIKYDRPTFVESVIVMISDNVASTIEYIDKTGDKKFTIDKIIDNIFRIRLEKGTLDESGLSVKDFKRLKEFFQNEFKSKKLAE